MSDIEAMAAEVDAHRIARPTEIELAVLHYISLGHTYRTTARELDMSLDTAKRHAHNAIRKLAATNSTHAVTIAIGRGLIPGANA
ncbi:response regulator transcription factor [Kutzneria albida]|uniref:HTH luxR-type domain-containing protein n=1 Tax=Kutzneria albida DSM 43870 TaxID=1449976 RepID=W5WJD1_9PSEU|nr:LuxR C-terminal-related transcriptional regulator [Kutzneria albida]AHH98269.1 hypothetical protein KALB_4907 [Kutzneria albida DSM 43870]